MLVQEEVEVCIGVKVIYGITPDLKNIDQVVDECLLTVFPVPFAPTINVKGFWNSITLFPSGG